MAATFTVTYDSANNRMVLTAAGLPGGTQAHTAIFRWENGEPQTNPNATLVRGSEQFSSTGFTVYDYTFATDVPLVYQLDWYDVSFTVIGSATSSPVTPTSGGNTWLKSVFRPYLNRQVTITEYGPSALPGRTGLLPILGQQNPVAVTDFRQSRSFVLTLLAANDAERLALELFLSFGDLVFLQTPGGQDVIDHNFFAVTDVKSRRVGEKASQFRYLDLTLQQVSEPSYLIPAYTATWGAIVAAFTAWGTGSGTVTNTFASWNAVNAYIASPSDVIQG